MPWQKWLSAKRSVWCTQRERIQFAIEIVYVMENYCKHLALLIVTVLLQLRSGDGGGALLLFSFLMFYQKSNYIYTNELCTSADQTRVPMMDNPKLTRLQVGQHLIFLCAMHLNVCHKIHTFPNCARPCSEHYSPIRRCSTIKSRIHVAEVAAAVAHVGRMFLFSKPNVHC